MGRDENLVQMGRDGSFTQMGRDGSPCLLTGEEKWELCPPAMAFEGLPFLNGIQGAEGHLGASIPRFLAREAALVAFL